MYPPEIKDSTPGKLWRISSLWHEIYKMYVQRIYQKLDEIRFKYDIRSNVQNQRIYTVYTLYIHAEHVSGIACDTPTLERSSSSCSIKAQTLAETAPSTSHGCWHVLCSLVGTRESRYTGGEQSSAVHGVRIAGSKRLSLRSLSPLAKPSSPRSQKFYGGE